jgi:hypothetical protein
MRSNRLGVIWQIISALVLSAAFTLLLRWAGLTPMTIALFISLSVFFFYTTVLARALLMARRPRMRPYGGPGGRAGWSGVREPRHPRPPYWPPRAAAAVPEDTEPQEPTRSVGYGESPTPPLRLKDGLA